MANSQFRRGVLVAPLPRCVPCVPWVSCVPSHSPARQTPASREQQPPRHPKPRFQTGLLRSLRLLLFISLGRSLPKSPSAGVQDAPKHIFFMILPSPPSQLPIHEPLTTKTTVLRRFRWNNEHGVPTWCENHFFNPKGIASFSPALARFREGLRRVANNQCHNTESVAYQRLTKQMTLNQLSLIKVN